MLSVHVDNIDDIAIIACEGRIVRSEAAFKLRDAVMSQQNMRTIVLDLSEAQALEGGGLGMLTALLRWASDHEIELKLFNPTPAVQSRLENYDLTHFDIASFDDMMALVSRAENERHTRAA